MAATTRRTNTTIQRLDDSRVHDWYRFVLAFPDHLVESYVERFNLRPGHTVLDPFAGTGTTLVECKKLGIDSIGIDSNPVAAFASRVKSTWNIDIEEFRRRRDELLRTIRPILLEMKPSGTATQLTFEELKLLNEPAEIYDVPSRTSKEEIIGLIPKGAISPLPLAKTLVVRDAILAQPSDAIRDLFLLTLAAATVGEISNLGFGPEVYVSKKKKQDADVYHIYSRRLAQVEADLRVVQSIATPGKSRVSKGDARELTDFVTKPVDAVITSPPYPNEKDYTRTTRLEMVLLGFIQNKRDLRQVKEGLLRSNTRNVFVNDSDGELIADVPEIIATSEEIETRRLEKGATSGFERMYHRVVLEYFGGMYRVLDQLGQVMHPGGRAAIVLGDQMSFFRVPIKTAELLARVVEIKRLPFHVDDIETWRTRRATATRMDISETVLILTRCSENR